MRLRVMLMVLVLGASGVACHARPPVVSPSMKPAAAPVAPVPARREAPPAPPAPPRTAPPPAPTEADLFNRLSLDELNNEHPLADAFFDYDQAALRDDARAALQKDADWLLKWKQTSILIAGHCDERGTAEYNLALGNRRAASVRDYLVSLGVAAGRISIVSFGKEAPFCTDSETDACRSQNRRGHFKVTAK